ncbi:IQ calmodulin-binding motif-containing protein 1-like [Physella acuta]|uniref:IQ calmodulin-binding motif-containing protein 1-like n=1 Tax=Physella acuta TaxID=109671 RepID=UPI0027DD5792|nr:IQ calmodulin-binding motif-containing protein 1-like [Physella acuta]
MKLKRQQILRKLHEKKLQELDILLASEVERFLNNEKAVAATNIQTVWRGHRERSRLKERQYITKQVHAAITIQRKIRKWLDKKAVSKQTLPGYLKPSGLTDERKMKLYHQIRQWQQQNPPNVKSKEELETVHMFAQNELSRHYSHIRPYRNLEQQVESLTARLNTDMELVQLAPDLDSASMSDIDMYSCKPLPIKTAAKLLHSQTLKELQQPWWKTLVKQDFEEYYDKKEEAEAEAHLQTLGI